MLKYLRNAVSVVCVVACVLFLALWVRSYWRQDYAHCPLRSQDMLSLHSYQGRLWINAGQRSFATTGFFPTGWGIGSYAISQRQRNVQLPMWNYSSDRLSSHILLPHWLPTVILGALVAIFGIRLTYRFSLRALLIATTLIALVLGLVVSF